MDAMRKVGVIGHRNPDTDSICSAIAYADLKNKIGEMKMLCYDKYMLKYA